MKKYIRVILGKGSVHANECYENKFIGADYGIEVDLTKELPDNWKKFNEKYRKIWLENHPEKSKIAAGLACGMLWTVCKGINKGDVVLSPDGLGKYMIGEVQSSYYYAAGEILPHRRRVVWLDHRISRDDMSQELKNSTGSTGTTADISKYAEEIESLLSDVNLGPALVSTNESIENPIAFALEKHLEEFLVKNWDKTELGKEYEIYEEDGDIVGQQYPSDTGPIDVLAISKDRRTLLVVELKRGRVSDVVIGQIQRYMGYVKEELAEHDQTVKGVIIGLEDSIKLRRALAVTSNIDFFKYEVNFKLYR